MDSEQPKRIEDFKPEDYMQWGSLIPFKTENNLFDAVKRSERVEGVKHKTFDIINTFKHGSNKSFYYVLLDKGKNYPFFVDGTIIQVSDDEDRFGIFQLPEGSFIKKWKPIKRQ